MKTSFTRHAWARVLGRLSLGPSEVAQLLDWNLAVDIGVEPGSERVHRLFFSAPDNMCFVAIQDRRYGAVITVLPIDYHETIAWQVDLGVQEQARALACPGDAPPPSSARLPGDTGPSRFKLSAYVRSAEGRVKGVNLGSLPSEPYGNQLQNLLEDDGFFVELRERLAAKSVDPNEVEAVYVRFGQKGNATRISLHARSGE